MLRLYGRTTSYNVQKVLWLLYELDLSFEHIECGGKFGGLDSEEFLALNPFAKVPVLVDEDKVILESNTILRYLASTYGKSIWWFEDSYQRSNYEAWMDWSIDVFEKAFVGVFWGYYRMPELKRDWILINKSKDKCLSCFSIIETYLKDDAFLCGEKITLADISVGVFIYRLTEIDLGIVLPERTKSWYAKLQSRGGYQKYVMSNFTELKGREDY